MPNRKDYVILEALRQSNMTSWEFPHRNFNGKIFCKWGILQQAMFNGRRVRNYTNYFNISTHFNSS